MGAFWEFVLPKPFSGDPRLSCQACHRLPLVPPGIIAPRRAAKPGYKAVGPRCPPPPHALQPRFPNFAPTGRSSMIASHLLAYFFTELNHDQVQKVGKSVQGQLARF